MMKKKYRKGYKVIYKKGVYKSRHGVDAKPSDEDEWKFKGKCISEDRIEYRSCHAFKEWSRAIANGQIAPWTYLGGQQVYWEGNIYTAKWGGQEVPGQANGTQWTLNERCSSRSD